MSDSRKRTFYKPRAAGSLKEAQAELLAACGGVNAKARIGKTQLAACTDPDQPSRHLPVDVVMALERDCGVPIVTRYLALELNHIVAPLRAAAREPMAAVLGRITEDLGALLSSAAHDLQHGVLTKANAANALREIDDVLPAIIELRAAACDVLGGAP